MMTEGIDNPLSTIINESLFTSIFPEKYKINKIIPIFKKVDPNLLESYRLISFISALSNYLKNTIRCQAFDTVNNDIPIKNEMLWADTNYHYSHRFSKDKLLFMSHNSVPNMSMKREWCTFW